MASKEPTRTEAANGPREIERMDRLTEPEGMFRADDHDDRLVSEDLHVKDAGGEALFQDEGKVERNCRGCPRNEFRRGRGARQRGSGGSAAARATSGSVL
jgi:hypothetical protein